MKTKAVEAGDAKSLAKSHSLSEGSRMELVDCPNGDPNWIEYDPNHYHWYRCVTCGCSFEV